MQAQGHVESVRTPGAKSLASEFSLFGPICAEDTGEMLSDQGSLQSA